MRPLTNDLPDRWTTLFSQRGPHRRVRAGFIERAAESNHVVGDLLIAFVGFEPGASTNDTARVFQVPRLWLPRFARRLNLHPAELIEGLRDRLSSLDEAEEFHRWLWAHGWVYTWERVEIERLAIDQHLAVSTPVFPSRLPGRRRRVSILRTELIRSFHGYDEYLTVVQEGYLAACAQVAGVPSWELTPEMCLWAYPEISVDNWDECIEDGSDEMPFPIEEDVLGFAVIPAVMSITKGVTGVAFSCGDSDVWIADNCASYGVHPATNAARLSMLQTLAEDLGGGTSDEYILSGLDAATEAELRRWCDARWGREEEPQPSAQREPARRIVDRRPPTKRAHKAAARKHLTRTLQHDRGDSEYEIGVRAIVAATAELAGIRPSRVRYEHVRWAFPMLEIEEYELDDRGWDTDTADAEIWYIAGGATGVVGVSVGRYAILYAFTLAGTDYWFAEGAGCYYIEPDDIETRIEVLQRFISTQGGGSVHNLFGLPPARARELLEWASQRGLEVS